MTEFRLSGTSFFERAVVQTRVNPFFMKRLRIGQSSTELIVLVYQMLFVDEFTFKQLDTDGNGKL